MKENQVFRVTVRDTYNDIFHLAFTKHQYPSLMALITNTYPEEFGECKGKGLCGTCHVKVTQGILQETIEPNEIKTLNSVYNTDNNSRLACQIMLNKKINNITFKIINDN